VPYLLHVISLQKRRNSVSCSAYHNHIKRRQKVLHLIPVIIRLKRLAPPLKPASSKFISSSSVPNSCASHGLSTHRSTANPTNQAHLISTSAGIRTCVFVSFSPSTCVFSPAKACRSARWPLRCAVLTRGESVFNEPIENCVGNV